MKDPIQKAMKDTYKAGIFSDMKKLETLEKAQRKQGTFLPLSLTMLTTCCVMLVLFFLVKTPPDMTEISSYNDRVSMEQAYTERWEAFSNVVMSEFDEQARVQYLATSDWALQQALLEQEEGRVLAQLLEHMAFIVGNPSIQVEFPEVATFEQLTVQAPVLVEKLEKAHGVWNILKLGEKRLPNMEVFYMDFWRIIGNLILYSAIVYFLYSLWRKKRNPVFAVFQGIVVLVMLYSFVRPPVIQVVTSKEELLEQSLTSYKDFMGEWTGVSAAKVVDIEKFGEQLAVLVDVGDNIYILSNFIYVKERRGYLQERTIWGRDDILTARSSAVYEGDAVGNIFALPANHNIGHIEIENDVAKESVFLNIPSNKTGIYYLATPVSIQGEDVDFTFHYYDKQGNLLNE
ncbi:hypothetical protein P9B03_03590 [Metasolibacillus meyeri]|uniref:Uncharacterized protein n=1 Tax=Metasolibacillus meyeri TaxID=1071052 RepID=A0AAW9NIF8_9BACL|nr:hypothetical protein [Metasolibacillus meyeri]MEC1177557.1 hypothetical protein [Metasolibacillus meyeri]